MAQRLSEVENAVTPDDPGAMRLGDVVSTETVPLEGFEDGFYEVTPEQKSDWESQGKIGFFEALRRSDKRALIPFEPFRVIDSFKVLNSVNRIKDKTGNDEDVERVNEFLKSIEEERIRNYSIGGRIGQGIVELPAFMIEFIATDGLASLGRTGVKKAAVFAAREAAEKGALKFAVKTAELASGAALRTAVMPHRLAKSFTDRQIDAKLALTEDGIKLADTIGERPNVSFMKAIGDVMIENFSEETGPYLAKGAKILGEKLPKQFVSGILRLYSKLHPNRSIEALFTKAGYHGFLEEMGEERVGDFLRALTGVDTFGAKDPSSALDRLISSFPNGEELLAEAGILAFPGVTQAGIGETINLIRQRKVDEGVKTQELRELTDGEIDGILTEEKGPEFGPSTTALPEIFKAGSLEEIQATEPKAKTVFDSPEVIQAREEVEQARANGETININTPEREVLREKIANFLYEVGGSRKIGIPEELRRKEKKAFIVLGAPGSGKGRLEKELTKLHGALVINNDEAKPELPEFQGGVGAGVVHKESSLIVDKMMLNRAAKEGENLVVVRLGKNSETVRGLVKSLKEGGYEVNLLYMDVNPESAAERAIRRHFIDKAQGFVDPDFVINEVDLKPRRTYDTLKLEVDSYAEFSNEVPFGQEPILVESSENAKENIGTNAIRGRGLQGTEPGKSAEGSVRAEVKGSTEFPFGENAKSLVSPSPENPTVSRLEAQIQNIKDLKERGDRAQEALNDLKPYLKFFDRTIKVAKKGEPLYEEMQRIPSRFKYREGAPLDDVAHSANNANMGVRFDVDTELIDFLERLDQNVRNLRTIVEEGKIARKTRSELSDLRQRIRDIRFGMRAGEQIAKKQIKDVQRRVVETVRSAEIEPRSKARFLNSIAAIQTQKQLEEKLPAIEKRLKDIEDQERKRDLIDELKNVDIKELRPEFRKPIENILSNIQFAKPTAATLRDLNSLAEYLERNPDNLIPPDRVGELRRLEQKPASEMSVEELEGLVDAVRHAIKLNELKGKIIVKRKLREFKAIEAEAIKNLQTRHEQKNGSLSGLDSKQKEIEGNVFSKYMVLSFNSELNAQILDGEDGGVIQQIMYDNFDHGVDEQLKFEHEAEDYFKEKLKNIDISSWSRAFQKDESKLSKTDIPISGGRTITLTPAEKIAFYLHTLNENNARHLEKGGFAFQNTPSKIVTLKDADINNIVFSLSDQERRVALAIHEYFNSHQKDRINRVSRRLVGMDIARESFYFPIKVNPLDRVKNELIKGHAEATSVNRIFTSGEYAQLTLEGMGIFKERTRSSNAIILEDAFVAAARSIKQVGAYVGLAEPLRSAKELVSASNEFQKAVINIGERDRLNTFKTLIRNIEGTSVRTDNIERLTTDLINRVDTAILGLNPFVIVKQPISLMLATTEMPTEFVQRAAFEGVKKSDIAEMEKYHPQLRDRFKGNVSRELGEIASVGYAKRFFTGQISMSHKLTAGIQRFDREAVARIWNATKYWVESEGKLKPGTDEFFNEVSKRSWKVIRRTQPTYHIKDRSTIGGMKQFGIRIVTRFTSQRNKNVMIVRRAFENYNRSAKTSADQAALTKAVFMVAFLAPFFLMLIDETRDKLYGRDEKVGLVKSMFLRWLNINVSNFYVLGGIANSAISSIENGSIYKGYDVDEPVTRTLNIIADIGAGLWLSIEQAIKDERYKAGPKRGRQKWIDSLGRMFNSSIELAGNIYGLPLRNVQKLLEIPFKEKKTANNPFLAE